MMGTEEEQLRLLGGFEENLPTKWNAKRQSPCILTITLLSVLVNIIFTAFLALTLSQDHQCHDSSLELVFSPAENNVEYVVTQPQGTHDPENLYRNTLPDGSQNDDVDEHWDGIYKPYLKTAITKQEANGLTEPTTRIPGTDAYVVELEVFHQLHCLHYIRKALFSPNATNLMFKEDPDITPEHLDHCFDWVRQAVMCAADITPVPYSIDVQGYPQPQMFSQRTCRNWALITEWAEDHASPEVNFELLYKQGVRFDAPVTPWLDEGGLIGVKQDAELEKEKEP